MAIVTTDDKYYKDIANALRTHGEHEMLLTPGMMADAVNEVKIVQRAKGFQEGDLNGYEVGKQAQRDEFWAAVQNNGEITNYTRLFSNALWTDELFCPRYDFVTSSMYQCFMDNTSITRLDVKSDRTPLVIDASTISTSTGFNRAFYGMTHLVSINKIISRKEAPWSDAFKSCNILEEIRFDGIIGTDIDFSSCSVLSDESITSIKEHLYDFPSNGSNETRTIKFHSNIKKRLGDSGIAEFTVKGWTVG